MPCFLIGRSPAQQMQSQVSLSLVLQRKLLSEHFCDPLIQSSWYWPSAACRSDTAALTRMPTSFATELFGASHVAKILSFKPSAVGHLTTFLHLLGFLTSISAHFSPQNKQCFLNFNSSTPDLRHFFVSEVSSHRTCVTDMFCYSYFYVKFRGIWWYAVFETFDECNSIKSMKYSIAPLDTTPFNSFYPLYSTSNKNRRFVCTLKEAFIFRSCSHSNVHTAY